MKKEFAGGEELVRRAKKILLAAHNDPDGDAVGSILALKMGLEKLGKEAVCFCAPAIPADFRFLPGAGEVKKKPDLNGIDLIIGLDYGSFERLKLDPKEIEGIELLTFDHHQVDRQRGHKIINPDYSSTCELIYDFLNYLKVRIDREIATCLLAGIYDDTGGFRHPNTSARTLEVVADLLSRGALLQKIVFSCSKSGFRAKINSLHKALERLKLDAELGFIYSVITFEEVTELKNELDPTGVANILNSIPEANIAALLIEREPGSIEVRLRSRKGQGIDVAKIAQNFGGGGHKLAAGFQSEIEPELIIEKIKLLVLSEPGC